MSLAMEYLLPELVEELLLDTNYKDLVSYSLTNKSNYKICQNEYFWQRKLDIDYQGLRQYKPIHSSHQQQYKSLYNLPTFEEAVINGRLDHILHNKHQMLDEYSLNKIVAYGHIHILDWCLGQGILPNIYIYYDVNLDQGFEMLDWLYYHNIRLNTLGSREFYQIIKIIIKRCPSLSAEFILWLESHEIPTDQEITNIAVYGNSLSLIRWLEEERGFVPDIAGADNATKVGNIEILEWLASKDIMPQISQDLNYKQHDLTLMQWLFNSGIIAHGDNHRKFVSDFYYEACINNRFDILEQLHSQGFDIPAVYSDNGAVYHFLEVIVNEMESFSLPVLEWLANRGVDFDTDIISIMISTNFDVARWLINRDLLPDINGSNHITYDNKIEILELLESRGILPDVQGANIASYYGQLETLGWLESRGILPDIEGAISASNNNKIEALEWLAARNILPNVTAANQACYFSSATNDTFVLEWLLKRDILPNQVGIIYASSSINVLTILSKYLTPNISWASKPIKYGYIDIVNWLILQGVDLDIAECIENHKRLKRPGRIHRG